MICYKDVVDVSTYFNNFQKMNYFLKSMFYVLKFASICKHHLKMPERSNCDILLKCYFSFKMTLYISLSLKIAKLGLLECYFSFGSNWVFCQVKEYYKKSRSFRIVRIVRSWTIVAILLKIFEKSGSFWADKIIKS